MKNDPRVKLAGKLDAFANQFLSREEQQMYREVLERGGMTEAQVAKTKPGQLSKTSMAARAAKLDAHFFHHLLDW